MPEVSLRLSYFLFAIFCSVLCEKNLSAQFLIFQSSDRHAAYQNIPNFIRTIAARSEAFKRVHPDGKIIWLDNGDPAGTGLYSEWDGGWLDYELLIEHASEIDVALNLGNHEGLDLHGQRPQDTGVPQGEGPNELFVQQNLAFGRALSLTHPEKKIRTLNANLDLTTLGHQMFAPFQDISLPGNKRLRVYGYTLENYFQQTIYMKDAELKVFRSESVAPVLASMKIDFLTANQEGIDFLVFQVHDDGVQVAQLVKEFLKWKSSGTFNFHTKVILASGGHVHKLFSEHIDGIQVEEAGSNYSFTELEFNSDGQLLARTHFSTEDQKTYENFSDISDSQRELILRTQDIIRRVDKENSRALSPAITLPASLKDLTEEGRRLLTGHIFSRVYFDWLTASLKNGDLKIPLEIEQTVTLLNTLSYGWPEISDPLFEDQLTPGKIKQALFFTGHLRVFAIQGKWLKKAYDGLRNFGLKNERPFFTPITQGIYESNSQNDDGSLVSSLNSAPLKPDSIYLVVTDRFTGINGYKIPEIEEAFQHILWEADDPPLNREIMLRGLPGFELSCSQELSLLLQKIPPPKP